MSSTIVRRAWTIAAATGLATVLLGVACEDARAPGSSPPASPNPSPSAAIPAKPKTDSPVDAVRRLNTCRLEGRYEELADLLAPEQRRDVMEIVRAVDELIAAENAFRKAVRRRLGEGSAAYFAHRAQVANILGPLSRDVIVLGQIVDGDVATVSFQVAGRVPVETVRAERREGKWYVVTDAPIEGLADALRDLAKATRRVTSGLEHREWTRERLERELDLRHSVVLERIAKLTEGTSD